MTISTVATAGLGAILALSLFNTANKVDPASATTKVTAIRQAVSVITAIADGIWAILDALVYARRGEDRPARSSRHVFGARVAADDA